MSTNHYHLARKLIIYWLSSRSSTSLNTLIHHQLIRGAQGQWSLHTWQGDLVWWRNSFGKQLWDMWHARKNIDVMSHELSWSLENWHFWQSFICRPAILRILKLQTWRGIALKSAWLSFTSSLVLHITDRLIKYCRRFGQSEVTLHNWLDYLASVEFEIDHNFPGLSL